MAFSYQHIVITIIIFTSYKISTQANKPGPVEERISTISNLIHQFLLMCGYDYICDISKFPLIGRSILAPYIFYNKTGICPSCHCDGGCMSRGDCCPDVYFALPPLTCVNTTILNATYFSKNMEPKCPSYEIVTSCPEETVNKERQLCEKTYTVKELLTRPPVASTSYPVSYKNKYCASCNGEYNTTNWILDIDCLKFADFNFLSTYQDIIHLARNRECRMRYTPMQNPARPCKLKIGRKDIMIRTCNVTKSWKAFDQSIKMACESTYLLEFHHYKNVFCYMCNPPKHMPGDVIDQCNATGMWYPYDAGLERACMYHSTSQNTRPFKNIFCYLCNRITNDNETFYDVTTRIKEDISSIGRPRRHIFSYMIKTGRIRHQHLRHLYTTANRARAMITHHHDDMVHNGRSEVKPNDVSNGSVIVRKENINLNVTYLAYKVFAVRPFDQFCDKTLVPLRYSLAVVRKCSCKPSSCLFRHQTPCCLDVSLTYPASCMDMYAAKSKSLRRRGRNTKTLFLTDGCWNNAGHPVIRNRCISTNQTSASSFLPLIEKFQNTNYKSFDCYLCNKNVNQIFPTDKIERRARKYAYFLADIDILCYSALDYSHLASFKNLIDQSKYLNCTIMFKMNRGDDKFNIQYPRAKCKKYSRRVVQKCNVTGNWPQYDPDVAWACEEAAGNTLLPYKGYKNFYCYLCNPEHEVIDVISTCNVTGKWQYYNINYERACHLFPRIFSYPKYKNIFCEVCNSAEIPDIKGDEIPPKSDFSPGKTTRPVAPFQTTFRSIFSVAEYEEDLSEMDGERCRKTQVYDYQKNKCRNTSCFPGKVLNETHCIPLLSITNNLRYTISLELAGNLHGNETNALDFLTTTRSGIKRHISQIFGTTDFILDTFHLLSNFPCETTASYINTENVKMLLYMTVHIKGYVPRLLTENSLLESFSGMWNISVDSERVIGLTSRTSFTAMITPSIIQQTTFKETCYLQKFSNHTFIPLQTFRSVYMSKILLCRQIELESDEYDIYTLKMELRIHSIGKTLPFDKFQRSSHGRVRVCVEDVEAISDPPTEYVDPALSILTFVCNIASMICLFLTFIVYLINPTLQSIPGINNMCLVVALFFTQLAFQFGLMSPVNSEFCVVVGIVLHFLWLSVFGCMNICSFHMFRVFSGIGRYHALHNKTKTLKNYIVYSFGLPAVIVFVNTVFTLGFHKGQTTGYGVDKCFISSKISFIVTFLLPIITICLSNLAFFSITAYKIRTTPRVDSNQENHRQFTIYVKLFIITGVTWLFTVIEAFFPLSVVSYLTTVLSGCQGVFIFVAFIVNKRVYVLLKEGYENASRRFSRSTSSQPATQSSNIALSASTASSTGSG